MMQRYSSELNAPTASEGDAELLGVDTWSAPENIQKGLCQEAVNMDFTSGDAATRGGFVCLPSTSSNRPGIDWTERTSANDYSWEGMTYGAGLFVAVAADGATNRVMTSPDGITWTARTSADETTQWEGITYAAGLFVAVGSAGAGNRVMTSPDGITWTARTASEASDWQSVAYGSGLYVAVASAGSNRVMTSPDGVTWTSRAVTTGSWRSVTFGNGLFVAVGDNLTGAMYSLDGITWTTVAVAGASWQWVTYGNGLFVAVGSASQFLMTSPDGATWTLGTAAANNFWQYITFGDGLFVAVSSTGTGSSRVMTSLDGTTWTIRTAASSNSWTAVAFGGGVFVAVGASGTGNRAMTSGDPVYASAIYSDPNDTGSLWVAVVKRSQTLFYASGRTTRTVSYASGLTVSEQSTVVQANNQVFIFRGSDATPLRWSGNWGDNFELATGSIQNSNQALYSQNRLWEIVGKDSIYASDVLDFTVFNSTDNSFNLSKGDSNYLVTTYPFGDTSILVFKNQSIHILTGVDGSLADVVASEITRQVGAVGINAVVSVGPDVVYMSNRNINLITLTTTNNSLQHKTLPLSRNIQKIFNRVNWDYAYKVSMGFYDNKLFVALPLDNATACNTVVVYNFVTEAWFGEWNFDSSLGISIQNFVVANYLGLQRLHAVTEDGRIFVVGDGQNDISGTTVADISTSLTTRAYSFGNQNHTPSRLYLDLGTNNPTFSVTAYSEGVSEYTEELSGQTFSRSQSWIFNDSTYTLTNVNDDYNRAGRKDYSSGTGSGGIASGSGFLPEAEQEYRLPILSRRNGRLSWLKVENTTGVIRVMTVGFEARSGNRNNYIQVL
jgi:hypothetical protein